MLAWCSSANPPLAAPFYQIRQQERRAFQNSVITRLTMSAALSMQPSSPLSHARIDRVAGRRFA